MKTLRPFHFTLSAFLCAVLTSSSLFFSPTLQAENDYHGGKELRPFRDHFKPLAKKADFPRTFLQYVDALDDQEQIDMSLIVFFEVLKKDAEWKAVAELHDRLMQRNQPGDALLAAELLFKSVDTARGRDLEDYPDALCDRAAALLAHPDPVVQAMAQWTLELRIHKQNGSENWVNRMFVPGPTSIDWFNAWKSRPADLRLGDDYGRQLVNVNRHRTLEALTIEIDKQEARLAAMVRDDQSRRNDSAIELFTSSLGNARQALESGNLTYAHQAYIALRKAGRNLIEQTRPEFPHEGFIFHTAHGIPGGDNNINGAVVGRDLPLGDIYVKPSANPAEPATSLLGDKLGSGSLHGIDLSWESDKLLFSLWHKPLGKFVRGFEIQNAKIYEMDLASQEIRQITDPVGANDIEPIFLPDGGYMFASDRSSFGNQCAGAFLQDKRCTTLYRYGSEHYEEPVAISNNKDFDRFPVVLNDGTVGFLHWEYQERHFYNLHTVWRCRPDGTNMDAFYKQHINYPMSIRTVRQVPDSNLCVATAQGHHDGHYGPVILFDPTKGVNNEEAMVNVTPGVSKVEGGLGPLEHQIVPEGGVENRGGRYINPFPMSEKAFITGLEMSGDKVGFGIYYIDVWGNRELLHKDELLSCFQPFALRQRERPPVVADTVRPEMDHATVFVENVYRDLPGVEPGAVKYLRISQRLFLPSPAYEGEYNEVNHLHYLPGVSTAGHFSYWNWAPTRTIGIVEVEEDGSAFFKVPAAMPVFLQALDENYCEVRRMRTSFTLQRGEFRGCVGCHETKSISAGSLVNFPASTMKKGPQTPEPPSWGDTAVMDFEEHIQPVLERHCVECHGADDPAGGLEFTSRKFGGYMQSYRTMFGLGPKDPTPVYQIDYHKPLHPDVESDPLVLHKEGGRIVKRMQRNEFPGMLVSISNRHDGADVTMPYEFGSNQSKLIRTLLDDPKHRDEVKARMSKEDWLKLVTFVDHNAIYHGTVIDKSDYRDDGSLVRVKFDLPSPWQPADTCPSFFNEAELADLPSGSEDH